MECRKTFKFHTPSSMMVVGPSGCGKTVFPTKLLLNNLELFVESPKSIHYCYGSWQKGYEPLKKGGVKFHEGVPDSESLPKWFPQGGVLVMDDLMHEGSNNKSVLDLFTKHSHHQNISVIYLCLPERKIRQDHLTQCALRGGFQEPTRSTRDAKFIITIVSYKMAKSIGDVQKSDR